MGEFLPNQKTETEGFNFEKALIDADSYAKRVTQYFPKEFSDYYQDVLQDLKLKFLSKKDVIIEKLKQSSDDPNIYFKRFFIYSLYNELKDFLRKRKTHKHIELQLTEKDFEEKISSEDLWNNTILDAMEAEELRIWISKKLGIDLETLQDFKKNNLLSAIKDVLLERKHNKYTKFLVTGLNFDPNSSKLFDYSFISEDLKKQNPTKIPTDNQMQIGMFRELEKLRRSFLEKLNK